MEKKRDVCNGESHSGVKGDRDDGIGGPLVSEVLEPPSAVPQRQPHPNVGDALE